MQFFIGIILLAVGLFILSKRVMIQSSWHVWRIGSFGISSGFVTIPLIIGVIWYFYNSKSIWPKIIITLGVSINFVTTSMFDYVIMFGMIGAGSGVLLKTLFKKR